MSLSTTLVVEYLQFKSAMHEGRKSMFDMTDREQAGLWIQIYNDRALTEFDSIMITFSRTASKQRWPTARALIAQALKESS